MSFSSLRWSPEFCCHHSSNQGQGSSHLMSWLSCQPTQGCLPLVSQHLSRSTNSPSFLSWGSRLYLPLACDKYLIGQSAAVFKLWWLSDPNSGAIQALSPNTEAGSRDLNPSYFPEGLGHAINHRQISLSGFLLNYFLLILWNLSCWKINWHLDTVVVCVLCNCCPYLVGQ